MSGSIILSYGYHAIGIDLGYSPRGINSIKVTDHNSPFHCGGCEVTWVDTIMAYYGFVILAYIASDTATISWEVE